MMLAGQFRQVLTSVIDLGSGLKEKERKRQRKEREGKENRKETLMTKETGKGREKRKKGNKRI